MRPLPRRDIRQQNQPKYAASLAVAAKLRD
jgi:hypothetical protein